MDLRIFLQDFGRKHSVGRDARDCLAYLQICFFESLAGPGWQQFFENWLTLQAQDTFSHLLCTCMALHSDFSLTFNFFSHSKSHLSPGHHLDSQKGEKGGSHAEEVDSGVGGRGRGWELRMIPSFQAAGRRVLLTVIKSTW